jgi:hypothetical protein
MRPREGGTRGERLRRERPESLLSQRERQRHESKMQRE